METNETEYVPLTLSVHIDIYRKLVERSKQAPEALEGEIPIGPAQVAQMILATKVA